MPQVERYIEINAPIDECIKVWLDVNIYPLFIKNLEAVRPKKDTESAWIWTTWTPLGKDEEWEVQIDNLNTDWYALNNTWGAYRCNFIMKTLGTNRTAIDIILEYVPAPQAVRECGHRISHFPQHILDIDLEQLKSLIEHPVLSRVKIRTDRVKASRQNDISQYLSCRPEREKN